MTQIDPGPGYFVISATSGESFIQQTLRVASSAIVLALSWEHAGHTDVTVTDSAGKPVTPESYRHDIFRQSERRVRDIG